MIGLSSLRQAPAIKRTRAISYQEGNKPCPRQKIRRGNQPNIKSAPMIQKKMGLHHKNAPGLKMNPTVYQAWLLYSPMGPPKTEMYV